MTSDNLYIPSIKTEYPSTLRYNLNRAGKIGYNVKTHDYDGTAILKSLATTRLFLKTTIILPHHRLFCRGLVIYVGFAYQLYSAVAAAYFYASTFSNPLARAVRIVRSLGDYRVITHTHTLHFVQAHFAELYNTRFVFQTE